VRARLASYQQANPEFVPRRWWCSARWRRSPGAPDWRPGRAGDPVCALGGHLLVLTVGLVVLGSVEGSRRGGRLHASDRRDELEGWDGSGLTGRGTAADMRTACREEASSLADAHMVASGARALRANRRVREGTGRLPLPLRERDCRRSAGDGVGRCRCGLQASVARSRNVTTAAACPWHSKARRPAIRQAGDSTGLSGTRAPRNPRLVVAALPTPLTGHGGAVWRPKISGKTVG